MEINNTQLPSIDPATSQPSDSLNLTAWAIAKANITRPTRVQEFQQKFKPQRFIEFNTKSRQGRSSVPRLDLARTQNIDAVLIYIFGTDSNEPCVRCTKQYGIFQGCYSLKGIAGNACANCAYSSRGIQCTFHCKLYNFYFIYYTNYNIF